MKHELSTRMKLISCNRPPFPATTTLMAESKKADQGKAGQGRADPRKGSSNKGDYGDVKPEDNQYVAKLEMRTQKAVCPNSADAGNLVVSFLSQR